jgi:hypothetical protein
MTNKTSLVSALILSFLAAAASAQDADSWNGSAEVAQSVPVSNNSGGGMGDNTNMMISFYPELGGLSSQGPLVGQGYSFTGGFGASIQLTHSYFGAEFDLGVNYLNQSASYCSAVVGCIDYDIVSPAILVDFIANPYSNGPAYFYAMVGEGFNTVSVANSYTGAPTAKSNGPILGLGLMLVQPDSHFFGDFELRYTDWGNFGATGYSSVSNVAFLVKIGARIGPTSAGEQPAGRKKRRAAYYDEQPQPKEPQAPVQEQQQTPPDQGGGLY